MSLLSLVFNGGGFKPFEVSVIRFSSFSNQGSALNVVVTVFVFDCCYHFLYVLFSVKSL